MELPTFLQCGAVNIKQLYLKYVLHKYGNTNPSQSELYATVYRCAFRSQRSKLVRVLVTVKLYP